MKKKELIEIIRFAVRKELKELLPRIIVECIKGTKTQVRSKKVSRPTDNTDPVEITKRILEVKPKSTPKKKKDIPQYTKNDALNEALAATAGGIPQEGSRVSGHDSATESQTTDFTGEVVDVETLPEPLADALTRDYSELMKAIDKKKGGN